MRDILINILALFLSSIQQGKRGMDGAFLYAQFQEMLLLLQACVSTYFVYCGRNVVKGTKNLTFFLILKRQPKVHL